MTDERKEKVIHSLKSGKLQGSGQSFDTLANVAGIIWAYKFELSSFLQQLKRKGKVSYFSTTKVWFWDEEVKIEEI